MRRHHVCMALALITALAIVATACGSDGSTGRAGGDAAASSSTTASTTSTTQAADVGRPTTWRDETAHWQQLAPGRFAEGPAAVADDLAARYRGGDTSEVGQVMVDEVRTGEPLVVLLRETGVSDGVLGRDIEITLEGSDEGWGVVGARTRDFCVQVDESKSQCG